MAEPNQTAGYELKAATLNKNGTLEWLDGASVAKDLRRRDTTTWVHVLVTDPHEARKFLQHDLGFHPLTVEDALNDTERPAMQELPDAVFLSASAVEDSGTGETYIDVGFFMLEHALVTVANKPVPSLEVWFDRWCEKATAFGDHPAYILHAILDAIVDNYFPITDALEEAVENLADSIYTGSQTHLQDAMALKRRLLEIRRHVAPMRDVINGLLRRDVTFVPQDVKPYLQDVYDHTLRIADIVDINRETLATALDANLVMISNNLSTVMRKMTVYATILMSMALVTGIYGMNFRFMPELDWRIGYPIAIGLMALIGMVEWFLFRKQKWI